MEGRSEHPLRQWRRDNRKTLADVGEAVGVVPSYISDLETKNTKVPSLTLAAKLSDLTGIPIDKFAKPRAEAS